VPVSSDRHTHAPGAIISSYVVISPGSSEGNVVRRRRKKTPFVICLALERPQWADD
jgi:hypothetical protein